VQLLLALASLGLHGVDLLAHAVLLLLQLTLPELDVVDALAQLLVTLVLVVLGQLLLLARQTLRVRAQTLGSRPHLVRGQVVGHLGLVPAMSQNQGC